jgi:CBS domain-containing protein
VDVEHLMTHVVATCHPFDKLLDAAERLDREDLGCLPVVAGDGSDRLVGLLTDRDVSIAAARAQGVLEGLQVREAMGGAPVSCSARDSVLQVLERMGEHAIRRLPVTDRDGRLIGLISLADIALAVAHGEEGASQESRRGICRALARRSRLPPEGTEGNR